MRLPPVARLLSVLPALGILCLVGGAPAGWAGTWQVILVAGDDAQPVFDNAARELSRRLLASGVPSSNIRRLSASNPELASGIESATAEHVLRRITELPARPGDECLIFLTSHGERGSGLWLARSDRALTPEELARALSHGCASVPTVVIISACYSGSFATGQMTKPNRVILTAARGDR
ncbi:MAG: hypothetical protein JO095_01405, partial [Alphaproteobacteria bacterium]|nr:hypothetical protein [Alphaproteobacteria bacterium]